MALASEPERSKPIVSLADVTPTGTPAAFGSLDNGPDGKILVTMHPSSTGIARVGGPNTTATRGQPFAPGSSYTFDVSNASALWHVLESGTPNLCATAV